LSEEWSLAITAAAVLAVASVSGRIAHTSLTPAILFVAIGVLVGPRVLGEVDLSSSGSTVRTMAEATLALVPCGRDQRPVTASSRFLEIACVNSLKS
jgi:hypothetical protein